MSYSNLPIHNKPNDELRRILITTDGLGSKVKEQCLDELIKRSIEEDELIRQVVENEYNSIHEDLSRRHS
jgi:serine/threonine protein phosphatase PrpC